MITIIQLVVTIIVIVLALMLGYWVGYLIGTMNRNNYIYEQCEIKENKIVRLTGILGKLRKEYINELIRAKLLEKANGACYEGGYKDCYDRYINKGKPRTGMFGIDEEGKINQLKSKK